MPWVKIDDRCTEHPKIARVGSLGLALWVCGLAYCNRNLTDGFIPDTVAKRLTDEAPDVIGRLVEAGVWHAVDGGYEVHDFLSFQPSKADVEEERQAGKERAARSRSRRRSAEPAANVRESFGTRSGDPVPVPEPVVETPSRRSRAAATGFAGLTAKARPADPLWDALVDALGLDAEGITKGRRGRLNAALRDLREVGATPDEVKRRAKEYRRLHPDWEFTETALATHWASLARKKPSRPPVERLAEEPEPDVSPEEQRENLRRIRELVGGGGVAPIEEGHHEAA